MLSIWKAERERKGIFYPLVQSQNRGNHLGWARPKAGACRSVQVLPCPHQCIWTILWCCPRHLQRAASKVQRLWFKLASVWNADPAGSCLPYHTTASALLNTCLEVLKSALAIRSTVMHLCPSLWWNLVSQVEGRTVLSALKASFMLLLNSSLSKVVRGVVAARYSKRHTAKRQMIPAPKDQRSCKGQKL